MIAERELKGVAYACMVIASGTAGYKLSTVLAEGLSGRIPAIELTESGKLEFQSARELDVDRGIQAARQICSVKNIVFEQQADGVTKAAAECEPGTLKLRVTTPGTVAPR